MKKIILVSLLTTSMVVTVFAAKFDSGSSSKKPSVASVLSFTIGKENKQRTCTYAAAEKKGEVGTWSCEGYVASTLAPITITNSDESVVTCTSSNTAWGCAYTNN